VRAQPAGRRHAGSVRPGAGQSPGRAPRGWHPDDIVAGYLVPQERVVLEETRSVRGFLVGQTVWIVLGLLVAVLMLQMLGSVVAPLVVVALGALGAVIGVRAMQAWFTRYVVTDLRVMRVHGILNRHAEFIPWGKVTDITRSETIFQWMARTATIRIESANERSGLRAIDDVDDPGYFYRVLVEMVDRKQGRIGDVTPPRRS
jgi:uncharacterized membrane protein YdbT with pleckstrin-like domain